MPAMCVPAMCLPAVCPPVTMTMRVPTVAVTLRILTCHVKSLAQTGATRYVPFIAKIRGISRGTRAGLHGGES
jgi:hypothetical protein